MLNPDTALEDIPIVFVDVETTGLRPRRGDRVCEVAVLRCEHGEPVDGLQQLVHPQRRMSPAAFAVHGISDEMLRDAPTFDRVASHVRELLEGAVFVGHNAFFDLGFLAAEFERADVEMPPTVALDTLRLARRHYDLQRYSLTHIAQALHIQFHGDAHRAMADVLLTRALFGRLVEHLCSRGSRTLGDYMEAQGGALVWGGMPNPNVPPLIQEALREDKLLYLRYRASGGEETERLVRPLEVAEQGDYLYLLAYCLLRCDRRSFRVDRILEVDLVESFE